METVSSTEVARRLSDLLNRVRYQNESFVITRGGEEIARLTGVARSPATLATLIATVVARPSNDPSFADDLIRIQAEQPVAESDPWAS